MAKNREKLAKLLGAKIVGEVPDVGSGAFGMTRMAHILHQQLTPSQGERPGRPTQPRRPEEQNLTSRPARDGQRAGAD
jgi:hypothetical protein